MSKVFKIVRDIIFVLAILVLIAAGLCFALQIKTAVVISGSMEPTIHIGSLAFIDQKKTEPVKGDIIAFETGGAFVTHRVAEKTEAGYITKGDNNTEKDPWVIHPNSVVGTTVFWVPKIGYFIRSITTKTGIIICISLCVCLFLASLIKKEDRNEA